MKAGFSFDIANYDESLTYTVEAVAGSVSRSGATVTVTGLANGATTTVLVEVSRTGYTTVSLPVVGSALLAIVVPAPVVVPGGTISVQPANDTTGAAAAASDTRVPPLVGSGAGAVTMDGVAIEYDVTQDGPTRTFTGVNDTTVSVTSSGSTGSENSAAGLRIPVLGQLTVGVTGFREGSVVEAWVFSTPTFLGEGVVAAGNTMSGDFTLPEQIRAGHHTLVVTGLSANGEEASFSIKLAVTDDTASGAGVLVDSAVEAPAGLGTSWWIILSGLVVVLVGGLVWFLIARRRRDEDERTV